MIEQLIDSMIDADIMLVLKRTAIFMDALAQKSKKQFGIPIDPAAGHLFYVSGNPGNLSDTQQAFIQELAAECRAAFRESILELFLLAGFQKRGLLDAASLMYRIQPTLLAG